jgi:hypothetical protein
MGYTNKKLLKDKNMEYIGLFNYDLDGVTSAIYLNREYKFKKYFACGYGKLDANIKKTIEYACVHDIRGLCIADWSLTLEQYKELEPYFDHILYIDHHPTSQPVYDYLGLGEVNHVLCAGAQCARYVKKLGHKLSDDDKKLIGACNAYDNWQTGNKNFPLGSQLTDLFYSIHFWKFVVRFDQGYDQFRDVEERTIKEIEQERQDTLDSGIYEPIGKESLVAILERSNAVNVVSMNKPGYEKYFMIYPAQDGKTGCSLSIRTITDKWAVGEALQVLEKELGKDIVVSAGGHDQAGAINFISNDVNEILGLVEEFITNNS